MPGGLSRWYLNNAFIGMMEGGFEMTTVGAGGDEDELDDTDLRRPRGPMYLGYLGQFFFMCGIVDGTRHLLKWPWMLEALDMRSARGNFLDVEGFRIRQVRVPLARSCTSISNKLELAAQPR